MNVNTILNLKGRNVISVEASKKISEVTKIFAKHRIGSILVLEDGNIEGILSERDVVRAIGQRGAEALNLPVSQVMTKNVTTCEGRDTIVHLMTIMSTGRFRHVPVVEDGELKGIVSIGDVVQHRIAEAELEANAMREYIATG